MIPLCIDQGVGVIPWSPLARGLLAGNRPREGEGPTLRAKSDDYAQRLYDQPGDYDVVDSLIAVAEQLGASPAQVALAWLLDKPGVTAPIVGASKMRHLEEAVAAVELALSDDVIAALEAPYRPHPVLGHQ